MNSQSTSSHSEKIRIAILNSLDARYGSTYRIRAFDEMLQKEGYTTRMYEGGASISRGIWAALRASSGRFDLLLTQKFNPVTLLAIVMARLRLKPVLVDWDDYEPGLQGNWLKKGIALFCEYLGPHLVTRLTTHSARIECRAHKKEIPVTMVLQGYDDKLFLPSPDLKRRSREKYGYSEDIFVVGHLCTLTHGGTLDLSSIFESWAQVNDAKIRFLLIGGGPLEARVRKELNRVNLSDHVQITGLLPHENIPEALAALDLGVVFMKDTEANRARMSFKMIEYLAMNVPIVGKVVGETYNRFGQEIISCEEKDLTKTIQQFASGAGRSRTQTSSVDSYRWSRITPSLVSAITALRKDSSTCH